MGSSPSMTIEVPKGHHVEVLDSKGKRTTQGVATVPSHKGQKGFKEVELKGGGGSKSNLQKGKTKDGGGAGGAGTSGGQGGEDDQDFHAMMSQMQREKTSASAFEQPKYEEDEDMVLETFHHGSGKTFSCLYQNGQRFYLDTDQTQDWQPFPKHWYKEGVLQTERILGDEEASGQQPAAAANQVQGPSAGDDREGFIEHPVKGRLPTYIYEEKRNVHYYFNNDSGCWVRLPVSWELHSQFVQTLLRPVEEALPLWTDKQDMVAALRASNYDPHECVGTYLLNYDDHGKQDPLAVPRNKEDAKLMKDKDEHVKELEKKVKGLTSKYKKTNKLLEQEREERRQAESMVQEMREQVSSLEVEAKSATAHVAALHRERPKTARPPSSARNRNQPAQLDLPTVEPETVLNLKNTIKILHKEYIKLKMDSQERFSDMQHHLKQLSMGVAKIRAFDGGVADDLAEMKELYRREALQRKLLYNKLQEMRGNIRVFCRCRYDQRTECAVGFPSDRELQMPGNKKPFKFDKVFTPRSTQEEVFEDTLPIITSCVDGYNVCIMAYGQTGSGKTFTMQGPRDNPGVNIRSLRELLQICQKRENVDYTLKASMVEIYNETIQDLLTSDVKQLDIRTQGNKIHLPGLSEMFVESLQDIEQIISLGEKNRTVASTKMNSQSSRSHLLFMINVEGHDKASGATSRGGLTLCDLAGSERVGKTEATGQRLVEAAAINKSLSSLGQVFSALRTSSLHVPYRNSKLTHILQPCLGGDAKACLFVNISPDESNLAETTSTAQFGSNARQVQLGQAKQNIQRSAPVAPANNAWDMEDM